MKKIVLFILMLIFLGGCLSKEERNELQRVEKAATQYIEKKYHQDVQVKESGYIYSYSLFANKTDNMYVLFDNGIRVVYYAQDKIFADDGQTQKIIYDLKKDVWNPMVEKLGDSEYTEEVIFNQYYDIGDDEGCYFTTYYDGDIQSFVKKENIIVNCELMVITNQNEWKQKLTNFTDQFYKTFSHLNHGVRLNALTKNCYEKYLREEYRYPNIDMNECYARWDLHKELSQYNQKFIYVGEGIYITAYEANFELQDGDIQLVRSSLTKQDILDKTGKEYQVDISSPIFQFNLSQRVKDSLDDKLFVYIQYRPQQTSYPKDHKLYYYPINNNTDYSYSIYSAMSDSDSNYLVEEDYYWIGKQEKARNE